MALRCAGHSAISASSSRPSPRPGDREVGEDCGQVDRPFDGRRASGRRRDDHGVGVEEPRRARRRLGDPADLAVGGRDRVACASGPCLCECVSLSGSESSRKSNRSRAASHAATQPAVPVAHARQAELRPAAGVAAGEEVGVEELARPVAPRLERVRRRRGRSGVSRDVVLVAARDRSGRSCPGRSAPGVVERLEDASSTSARGARGSGCRRCR